MAGGAILRRFASEDCECLTATSAELDLRRQADVEAWVAAHKPQAVFVAAGRVGGIVANDTQPVDFLYENLLIEANTIATAHPRRCREAPVPVVVVFLSAVGAAADVRGLPADRSARAYTSGTRSPRSRG